MKKQRRHVIPLIIIIFVSILGLTATAVASSENITALDPGTNPGSSLNGGEGGAGNSTSPVTFILFYNRNCHDCQRVIEFLPGFMQYHPDAKLVSYDVANNDDYENLFQEYNNRYGKPFSPVPAVFVGAQELIGYDEITSGLGAAIAAARANGTFVPVTPLPTVTAQNGTGQPETPPGEPPAQLTVPLIITAALVDGINPCAFAVLVFLLITLLAMESRRKALAVGAAYTIAVFIFYFLSGLGIFAIVQVSGLSTIFSIVAAVVALIAGILMLRDAIGTSKPILVIPESRKSTIDTYIRKSSIPAAFVLGILVGMFELPCTGGIYLAILSLMSRSMTLAVGIPYLLLYNVIFIVPLVIIIILVSYGLSPERLETFRAGNRRLIRFGMAIVMIAIAGFLLFTALR